MAPMCEHLKRRNQDYPVSNRDLLNSNIVLQVLRKWPKVMINQTTARQTTIARSYLGDWAWAGDTTQVVESLPCPEFKPQHLQKGK
jgi:hypothetical protein